MADAMRITAVPSSSMSRARLLRASSGGKPTYRSSGYAASRNRLRRAFQARTDRKNIATTAARIPKVAGWRCQAVADSYCKRTVTYTHAPTMTMINTSAPKGSARSPFWLLLGDGGGGRDATRFNWTDEDGGGGGGDCDPAVNPANVAMAAGAMCNTCPATACRRCHRSCAIIKAKLARVELHLTSFLHQQYAGMADGSGRV
jgi:hypothetical protein